MKKILLALILTLTFASPLLANTDLYVYDPYPYTGDLNQVVPKSFIAIVDGIDRPPTNYWTIYAGGIQYAVILDLTSLNPGEHTLKAKACSEINGQGGCSEASVPFVWIKPAPVISPLVPKNTKTINVIRVP